MNVWRGRERVPVVRWITTGISIAVLGTLGPFYGGGAPVAAQGPACVPSPRGCTLDFSHPVAAALTAPDDSHLWWLNVPSAGDFQLVLANIPANYRLYAYRRGQPTPWLASPQLDRTVVE